VSYILARHPSLLLGTYTRFNQRSDRCKGRARECALRYRSSLIPSPVSSQASCLAPSSKDSSGSRPPPEPDQLAERIRFFYRPSLYPLKMKRVISCACCCFWLARMLAGSEGVASNYQPASAACNAFALLAEGLAIYKQRLSLALDHTRLSGHLACPPDSGECSGRYNSVEGES
jgi:hypothetical protein